MQDDTLASIAALISRGQHKEAITQLHPILKANRDNTDAWWLLAQALENDPDAAGRALKNVLRLRPNDTQAQAMLTRLSGQSSNPPTKKQVSQSSNSSNFIFAGLILVALVMVGAIIFVLVSGGDDDNNEPVEETGNQSNALNTTRENPLFLCNGVQTQGYIQRDIVEGTPNDLRDNSSQLHVDRGELIYGRTVSEAMPQFIGDEYAGPVYFFRFDGTAGDEILATLNWVSEMPQYPPTLYLITPDGLEVSPCANQGLPPTIADTLTQTGRYWLKIDGPGMAGTYTLSLGKTN